MDMQRAIGIVLDLARGNILEGVEVKDISLSRKRAFQVEAVETVEAFVHEIISEYDYENSPVNHITTIDGEEEK